jgi:2-methylcitrate dehydratase PrpD
MTTLLRQLIDLASDSYDPPQARRAGGRALFDHLACRADGVRRAPAGVGDAGAAVLGDLDDVHWPSLTHPGAIIWTVIRSAGVRADAIWRAAHMGYEVTARLGAALGAEHRRYWHATTTAGTIGGAVAIAAGNGGDPVNAAGHAISVTGGSILCVLERTDTRMLHRDHAAATAVRCARLSHLSAATDSLEHPRGLFAAVGGSPDGLLDPTAIPALSEVSFRQHETSGFAQAAVEAARELAPVDDGSEVELEVPESTAALAAIPNPRNGEEAWWSCQHAVAVTLLGFDLNECPVDHPSVAQLRARVRLQTGPMTRITAGGRTAQRERAAPLSDEELVAKWRRLNPKLDPPTELLL